MNKLKALLAVLLKLRSLGIHKLDFVVIMTRLVEGSWRTRLAGSLVILGVLAVTGLELLGVEVPDNTIEALLAILAVGTFVSRDDVVTSEEAKHLLDIPKEPVDDPVVKQPGQLTPSNGELKERVRKNFNRR